MPDWVTSKDYRALVDALIGVRQTAGLSQRSLADRLERPASFVGKVESYQRNVSVLELVAWCQACGAEPADVLKAIHRAE